MRILIGTQNYPPVVNGPATFTAHLAAGLAARGHEVTVTAPSEDGGSFRTCRNGVLVEGIRSLPLPGRSDVRIPAFPGGRLRRVLDRFRPDVVHIQDHYPISWSLLRQARHRGIPVVATNHFLAENVTTYLPAVFGTRPFRRIVWRAVLAVFERATAVTTPTRTGARIFRGAGLQHAIEAISCGVDTDRFRTLQDVDVAAVRRRLGLSATDAVALFLGRVEPEKDLPVLVQAMARADAPRGLQIAVAGTGGEAQALRHRAAAAGLDGRVTFLGPVPDGDHVALLNSVDLFVMPSPAELESLATLEAMAASRPVIAARAGALPELVDRGNGALFEAGDPAAAAAALRDLLQRRSEWPALGTESRRRALERSTEQTVIRYEHLYARLCRGPAQAPGTGRGPAQAPGTGGGPTRPPPPPAARGGR